MLKWAGKLLTKNYTKIPLFTVYFDLNLYKKSGSKSNSCLVKLHPELNNIYIKDQINNIIDYIRDNYDMEKISKI